MNTLLLQIRKGWVILIVPVHILWWVRDRSWRSLSKAVFLCSLILVLTETKGSWWSFLLSGCGRSRAAYSSSWAAVFGWGQILSLLESLLDAGFLFSTQSLVTPPVFPRIQLLVLVTSLFPKTESAVAPQSKLTCFSETPEINSLWVPKWCT